MTRVEIITPWIGTGTPEDSNRPKLGDYYDIKKWEDITGQPSANFPLAVSMYIILAECEASVLTQIETDADYQVLWSEEIVNAE